MSTQEKYISRLAIIVTGLLITSFYLILITVLLITRNPQEIEEGVHKGLPIGSKYYDEDEDYK